MPCHVSSGISEPESFDLVASTGAKTSTRFSDETGIIEKEIAELGINELFDPQRNEACNTRSGTHLGKNYL